MKNPISQKVSRWLLAATASAALIGSSAVAALSTTRSTPANLQLVVSVPPDARVRFEEDVADALSGVIQENLNRRGYGGTINYPGDDRVAPALVVKLVEWRTDPLGAMKCTLSASVRTANGTQNLGLFTGTSMGSWNAGGVGNRSVNRSEALRDAANDAVQDMTRALAKDNRLPGFAQLRK